MWTPKLKPRKSNCSFRSSHNRVFVRDTVKEWAGDSQWRALKADYQRFRHHGYTGWGSEGMWALVIYRAQRALRKSRRRLVWKPAALALAVLRKALHIIAGVDLHPEAEIGAGLLIQHASQVRVARDTRIGVDCTMSQICSIGSDFTPAPRKSAITFTSPPRLYSRAGNGRGRSDDLLVLSSFCPTYRAGHTAIGVPARILPKVSVPLFRNDTVLSPKLGWRSGGAPAASWLLVAKTYNKLGSSPTPSEGE